jgi:hypothetical protein
VGFSYSNELLHFFLNVSSTKFIVESCQFCWCLCFCTCFAVSFVRFGVGIGIDMGGGWLELTGLFLSNLFNNWIVLLSTF